MLTISMKKKMEYVLEKNVEVGHANNIKQLEKPKIDPKEVVTFHNGEQK